MTPYISAAAIHSFTISLRHQLKNTSVRVVEIAPPGVDTDMAPEGFPTIKVDVYADDVLVQLLEGKTEIGYQADAILRGNRDTLYAVFNQFNA